MDWGVETHHACVVDGSGAVVGERSFAHGGEGLSALAEWLLSLSGGASALGVAIETPRGPVVESLMERGIAVHSINPKQLDRFRDRHSPAGAKNRERLRYPDRAMGAAVRSSGMVESACGVVVGQRLKRDGMRSSVPGANGVPNAMTLFGTGDAPD